MAVIYAVTTPDIEPSLGPITLGVRLDAELEQTAFAEMQKEVDLIFAGAGVRFHWQSEDGNCKVHIILRDKPNNKVIIGCSRGLHDHRLGFTNLEAHHIFLWTSQVARGATGEWDSEKTPPISDGLLGRALGRVLAHELGHLFLGLKEHRLKGLMRASFKHRDLTTRSRRGLDLSSRDLQELRRGAEAMIDRAPIVLTSPPPAPAENQDRDGAQR